MEKSDFKSKILESLEPGSDQDQIRKDLDQAAGSYDFSDDFTQKVLSRISVPATGISRHIEFIRTMNWAFSRVALTGVAAIIIMIISFFLMEGSFSFSTMLGLNENFDDSFISLLTGN